MFSLSPVSKTRSRQLSVEIFCPRAMRVVAHSCMRMNEAQRRWCLASWRLKTVARRRPPARTTRHALAHREWRLCQCPHTSSTRSTPRSTPEPSSVRHLYQKPLSNIIRVLVGLELLILVPAWDSYSNHTHTNRYWLNDYLTLRRTMCLIKTLPKLTIC